ncbi:MAG: EamA family transporter [Myxococcota bacterium]
MDALSFLRSKRVRLWLAFAAVYLLWGSTYLAIRVALETMPPFVMAGTRFLVAGSGLYLWARLSGAARPALVHWRSAAIVGGLLLFMGNGGVVNGERTVPSGVAALLIAGTPMWMAIFDAAQKRRFPGPGVVAGLGLGVLGVLILIDPAKLSSSGSLNPIGAVSVLSASLAWSFGSIYSRRAPLPSSPFLATAMEMLAGGLCLLVLGSLSGELHSLPAPSLRSAVAWLWLVVAGSLIGFTAYIWLLRNTTAAKASTYAFVNPVIAVLLGWAIGGEDLSLRSGVAGAVIVLALVLITRARAAER